MSTLDLSAAHTAAVAACKSASRWAYQHNYVGGDKTISAREPNAHTLHLTGLHSWDYAKVAGCTTRTALAHLRKLYAAGLIVERKGWSGIKDFTLPHDEAVALGREIIAELQAEGLPFDDEWRSSRKAAA